MNNFSYQNSTNADSSKLDVSCLQSIHLSISWPLYCPNQDLCSYYDDNILYSYWWGQCCSIANYSKGKFDWY